MLYRVTTFFNGPSVPRSMADLVSTSPGNPAKTHIPVSVSSPSQRLESSMFGHGLNLEYELQTRNTTE